MTAVLSSQVHLNVGSANLYITENVIFRHPDRIPLVIGFTIGSDCQMGGGSVQSNL